MKTKKIILATSNLNKLNEFKKMFEPLDYEIVSLKDINFTDEIVESGETFSENSYIKAKTIYDKYHMPVVADDTGLIVDALDGAPGVHSHRYSGENGTDKDNRLKLISELKKIKQDKYEAHFECAITYIDNEKTIQKIGKLFGEIILDERGKNGFGYDPIFYVERFKKTTAELTMEEKNSISHRHDALNQLLEELKK